MNPSAMSAAVLQRGGTIPTICACCGELFHAKTMQAAYCGTNCRVRAYYYRRSGRPIPPKFSVVGRTQPIRPQMTLPEIPNPAAQASAPWWEPAETPARAPLAPFAYQGFQVRVVTDEQGVPWFVAADLLAVLDLDRKALERLDDDEKATTAIPTPGGTQSMTTVNEPGLYSLILGSRKPEARAFKRWVTHEVLPTIRRTGSYSTTAAAPQPAPIPALPSPITAERIQAVLTTCDPLTTNTILNALGLPCSRSNQVVAGSVMKGLGYRLTQATAGNCRIWARRTAAPPQPPALPSTGPAILIRAKTDREAAQLWCDAVEAATLAAIRRRLSTTYRDDSAIPYSSHWQRVAA